MSHECNSANFLAALRAATGSGLRIAREAADGATDVILALVFVMASVHLAAHPDGFGAVLHYPRQLAAGLLSFGVLLAYGLYRNRVKTICSLATCILSVGLIYGVVRYGSWVASVAPEFSSVNLLALYSVSHVSFSTHLLLLPAQIGVGLVVLVGTCMCLALVYFLVAEICRYGVKVRQQTHNIHEKQLQSR